MIDSEVYYAQIGGLVIKIENTNKVAAKVIYDLAAVQAPPGAEADVVIEIGDSQVHANYSPIVFSAKGSMNFNEKEFFVGYLEEVDYSIENLFNPGTTIIRINKDKTNLKKKLKAFYKGKLNIEKDQILSYGLFWYAAHISLLKKNAAFMHAGVFETNSQATLITGTGGCGKTSTLFKILESEKYAYLAEDFGIVDIKGNAFFNAKPVSVYASDMEFGQAILSRHFSRLTLAKKATWAIKRKILRQNPMKKIPPAELLGKRIGDKSKINTTLYFIRNNDAQISDREVSAEELAERVLDASMRELKTIEELLLLMRANAPKTFVIPAFEEIREQTRRVYLEAFRDVRKRIVYIPLRTPPVKLTQYLSDKGLI